MAVSTTYQDIIDTGYSKSTKNQPREIANEEVELLGLTHRTLAGLYSIAARFAPTVFAVISDPVAYAAPGWARPENAENVFRIEKGDGTEVTVPTFDDRLEPLHSVAVFELGGIFRVPAGGTDPDIGGDTLVFYYAKSPDAPTDLEDTLDELWKESYNELLAFEVALYLTLKDGREEEIAGMTAQRNRWARLFVSYLEHHTSAKVSRHSTVQYHANDMLKALDSVLTPGSEAIL